MTTSAPMTCQEFRVLLLRQARAGIIATSTELGIDPDEVFRRFVQGALGYRPDEVEPLNGFCPRCHHEMRQELEAKERAELVDWVRRVGVETVADRLGMDPSELRSRIGA